MTDGLVNGGKWREVAGSIELVGVWGLAVIMGASHGLVNDVAKMSDGLVNASNGLRCGFEFWGIVF